MEFGVWGAVRIEHCAVTPDADYSPYILFSFLLAVTCITSSKLHITA